MINIKHVLPVTILLLISVSCKKESIIKSDETNTFRDNSYFPMSIGSYWVYEYRSYYPDGEETSSEPRIDTLKILGDTLINNQSFFVFERNYPLDNMISYRRDSAGFIINQKGNVILPPNPTGAEKFSETISTDPSSGEVVSKYWYEVPQLETAISPAGDFLSLQQVDFHYRKIGDMEVNIQDTSYFAPIGQVQTSFSYISGGRNVGKLTGYHLE